MRHDITFVSRGVRCAGWLYLPDSIATGRRHAAIVMAHGFTAVKEMGLAPFAEGFRRAGFVVLVFDYRGFGASAGEPRGALIAAEQLEDYRNAISWVAQRDEVDAARIGVWGTSYSGGHALHLGAFDRRVRAVVAQVPFVDGLANLQRLMRPDVFRGTEALLGADRAQRFATGNVSYLPVVAPEGQPCALPTADALDWFTAQGREAPRWENRVTLESMEKTLEYAPAAHIEHVSPTPLLMIVARDDHLTPTDLALAAYARALEPKRLVLIDGGHFAAYAGAGFEPASTAATEWFRAHLG